jgi:type II secretory pathway pseudopilin PulG
MVVVIAIIVMILAAAMPLTSGLQQERELRDASVKVQQYAREARRLAVQDGETIDLMFTANTITFNRPNRVAKPAEGEEEDPNLKRGSVRGRGTQLIMNRRSEEQLQAEVDAPPPPDPGAFTLEEPMFFSMYSVEKKEWLPVEGWRWRFQPSGLCDPIEFRIYRGEAYMGARFAPLTAGIVEEVYYLP